MVAHHVHQPGREGLLRQNTTLVLHVCYFFVLLVCSLAYRHIEPHLHRAGVIGGLSALTATSLVPALLVVMGVLDPALYVPCIAVAAVAKALIFLAWMMAFSDILNPRSGIVLMLGSHDHRLDAVPGGGHG